MISIHRIVACSPGLLLAVLVLLPVDRSAGAPQPATGADFCVHVQQRLADTSRVPINVVHPDYAAFKHSKPAVEP